MVSLSLIDSVSSWSLDIVLGPAKRGPGSKMSWFEAARETESYLAVVQL